MITVLCTNLLDGATYAAPQGNPQRRSFKNVQVADLLRVLHDDMLVRRRVLLEMRHGLEELVVLTSVPADRSYSGGPNQCYTRQYRTRTREEISSMLRYLIRLPLGSCPGHE